MPQIPENVREAIDKCSPAKQQLVKAMLMVRAETLSKAIKAGEVEYDKLSALITYIDDPEPKPNFYQADKSDYRKKP